MISVLRKHLPWQQRGGLLQFLALDVTRICCCFRLQHLVVYQGEVVHSADRLDDRYKRLRGYRAQGTSSSSATSQKSLTSKFPLSSWIFTHTRCCISSHLPLCFAALLVHFLLHHIWLALVVLAPTCVVYISKHSIRVMSSLPVAQIEKVCANLKT